MNPLLLLTLLFAGMGLILIGISIPLIQRRIKPNYWYGYRTKRTLNNPHIWYDGNAYAGKRLLASGIITTVAALVLYFIPGIDVMGYTLGMTIFGLGPLVIGLSQSARYINQLEE